MHSDPVNPKELKGFYSFAVAMEGYGAMAVGILWPLILEGLAADNAVETDNPLKRCDTTQKDYHCGVKIGSTLIPTDSIVFYATTVSVLVQLVIFTGLGSLADHGNFRKTFMLFFAFSTALIGALVLLVYTPSLWWLAFIIYMTSNVTYGASFLFYYSFLPVIVRNSPQVLEAHRHSNMDNYHKVSEEVSNQVSSRGFSYGYFAAVFQLMIGSAFIILFGDGTNYKLTANYGMQIGIAFNCIWSVMVLLFATIPFVKNRPGPPLPQGENAIIYSYKTLYRTMKKAGKLPELFKFLAGWFIYSDGFTTINSIAVLYAKVVLGASSTLLLLTGVLVPMAAGVGSIAWAWIQKTFGWSTRKTLIVQVCLYGVLPLYGLIFLKSSIEIVPVGIYHGFILGGTVSACRVLFSELVPPGLEAEFFGLYEVTDKGSAWIGPLAVGAISNATGNIRNAFFFLLGFLLLPSLFFMWIDDSKGQRDAMEFSGDHLESEHEKK